MDITAILQNIGFSSLKSSIYQACLSLGTAPASVIATKSGIVRSTVYKILEELIDDGLVEKSETKVRQFTALHPTALLRMIDNQKQNAEHILPALLGMFTSTSSKPHMKFYEGINGKKKVFEDILNLHDEIIYTFSPIHEVITTFGKTYSRHFLEKRVAHRITRYALRPAHANIKTSDWELYASDKKLLREIRFLPANIQIDTLIQIYENKVAVISSEKENYAFIIQSQELSQLMKQIFLLLWNMAQK
jgi:sugar-specific transcriptional regulator TrmB